MLVESLHVHRLIAGDRARAAHGVDRTSLGLVISLYIAILLVLFIWPWYGEYAALSVGTLLLPGTVGASLSIHFYMRRRSSSAQMIGSST